MKTVYNAQTIIDAQLILDHLKSRQLDVMMTGYQLTGGIGELPANISPSVVVLNDEDYLLARSLVESFTKTLQGDQKQWRCDQCGELQEGNFNQCWHCGYVKQSNDLLIQQQTLLNHLELHLRIASNADCNAIKDHIFPILKNYQLPLDPNGLDSDLDNIEKNYLQLGGVFWVIVDRNDVIIATSALSPIVDSQIVELRKMYVNDHFRGKGLGKLLLNKSIYWAQNEGFKNLRLETAPSLIEARSLYLKFGFKQISEDGTSERCKLVFERELN